MGSHVKLDGDGVAQTATYVVNIADGEQTYELPKPNGWERVYNMVCTPIAGTAAYSSAITDLVINEEITGTATGTSVGVLVSGTGVTLTYAGTTTAKEFCVTLIGN